jgi:hypothetical protein
MLGIAQRSPGKFPNLVRLGVKTKAATRRDLSGEVNDSSIRIVAILILFGARLKMKAIAAAK